MGTVESVGPLSPASNPGDRVAGCFMQKWIEGGVTREKANSAIGGAIDGVAREYAVFSEEGLVAVPPSLS